MPRQHTAAPRIPWNRPSGWDLRRKKGFREGFDFGIHPASDGSLAFTARAFFQGYRVVRALARSVEQSGTYAYVPSATIPLDSPEFTPERLQQETEKALQLYRERSEDFARRYAKSEPPDDEG